MILDGLHGLWAVSNLICCHYLHHHVVVLFLGSLALGLQLTLPQEHDVIAEFNALLALVELL